MNEVLILIWIQFGGIFAGQPFLLEFGPENGDTFLDKDVDICSREISLPGSLRIGSRTGLDSLYVCTNGHITFTTAISYYNPLFLEQLPIPVIAPFFADITTMDNLMDEMCQTVSYYDNYRPEKICYYYWMLNDGDDFRIQLQEDYIADEALRDKVTAFDSQTFNRTGLSIYSDDYITMLVMGNDTLDPNLGNNIYKRVLTPSDLTKVSNLIEPKVPEFTASWGFVATWYKVATFPGRLDAFNSFQSIIACDVKVESDPSDDRCFVIFDFYEIQWTVAYWQDGIHARSGINDGNGFTYELPFSGMPESRNWWAHTNFDIPGIWVLEIDQTGEGDTVSPAGIFELSGLEFDAICEGPVEPDVATTSESHNFTISNCSLPEHSKVQVLFFNKNDPSAIDDVVYNNATFTLSFVTTHFEQEPAVFVVSVDGVILEGFKSVYFFESGTNEGEFENDTSNVTVFNLRDEENAEKIKAKEDQINELQGTGRITIAPEGVFNFTLKANETAYFIVLYRKDGSHTYPIPVFDRPESFGRSCEDWDSQLDDAGKDYSSCEKDLGKWYGCPRQMNSGRFADQDQTDAWWAHAEVANGMTGWQYDVCCNNNDSATRRQLGNMGYCREDECEYSYKADFCVVSPSLGCREKNNNEFVYVTNRCCYDKNGDLFTDNAFKAGSMGFAENSMETMMGYFYSEMLPYLLCCDKPWKTDICSEIYKKHRPTVTGDYSPRGIVMQRGDPHLQTVDGIDYPLMVLGVYTMLETYSDPPTIFQASTRQKGNGTVFSGFVTAFGKSHLECFIWEDSTFVISINGHRVTLGVTPHYILYNISVTESEDLKSFRFQILGNQMVIRVVITDDFLNIFTAVPPSFQGQMNGLLGHYDEDPSNDLTARDGRIVDINSDHKTIHDQFGETWKVNPNRWLFGDQAIFDAIHADIKNGTLFVPKYDLEFENEDLRAEAELACNGNFACMLDVSLVGDINFAGVYVALEKYLEQATFFEDAYTAKKEQDKREQETNEEKNKNSGLLLIVLIVVFTVVFVLLVGLLAVGIVKYNSQASVGCGSEQAVGYHQHTDPGAPESTGSLRENSWISHGNPVSETNWAAAYKNPFREDSWVSFGKDTIAN